MSCSSAIHTVNDTGILLTADSQIPFGRVIRRFGKYLTQTRDDIILSDRGYYSINCSITVKPSNAGATSAQLYLDGEELPGGLATSTAATAENPINIVIIAMVRIRDRETEKVLSVHILNDGTVENMSTVITKV